MVTATPIPRPPRKPKMRVPKGASIGSIYRSRPTQDRLVDLRRRYKVGAAAVLRILLELFSEDPRFHKELAAESGLKEAKPPGRKRTSREKKESGARDSRGLRIAVPGQN